MSIKRVLEDYCHFKKEQTEILREIARFRLSYKARLKKIDENLENLSKFILEYLEEHNHPGISFNGHTITRKEYKKVTSRKNMNRKAKEKNLEQLKRNHNLSDECYAEIYEKLLGNQETTNKIIIK